MARYRRETARPHKSEGCSVHRPRRTTLKVIACASAIGFGLSVASGVSTADVKHTEVVSPGSISLVSLSDADNPADTASRLAYARSVVSHRGRYVVFQSRDSQLAGTDTNGLEDVFLRDTREGTTQLVSQAAGVAVGGGGATVSADGRFVCFLSASPDLSPDDINGNRYDVFVRDMVTGDVTLVSRATDGTQRNRDSDSAVISADGTQVAFATSARLSAEDDDPLGVEHWKQQDVYVRDLAVGTTKLVSVRRNGDDFVGTVGLGGMSADGHIVGFTWGSSGRRSQAPGGFYVRDLSRPGSTLLWQEKILAGGTNEGAPAVSGDGTVAAFASKSNAIDSDPNYPVYDVALVALASSELSVISTGIAGRDAHGDSWAPTLSYQGDVVAFVSEAANIVRDDENDVSDVFRYERGAAISLLSRGAEGSGNLASAFGGGAGISGDGRHVAFHSFANDLVEGDANSNSDIFVWSGPTTRD